MQPTGKFHSNGIELAYFEEKPAISAPQRQHPILLVHGFASNSHMNWINTGWFKCLTESGYHTISFDNRGHGLSEKRHDEQDYGAHLMADDVIALCDQLQLDRVHLMGYSMGARISAFVAKKNPHRVKTVTFAGMGYNLIRGLGNPEPIAKALEAPSADDVTNPATKNFRVFAEQTQSDLKSLAACIRSTRVPIAKEDIAALKMPVLVAVGTEDVIAGSGQDLADVMSNATHLPIPNRDHMRAVGDKTYQRGVTDFLNQHDG